MPAEQLRRGFLRSRVGALAAAVYALAFLVLTALAYFDDRTFSSLPAVLLTWPWVDYIPLILPSNIAIPLGALLNAALIYVLMVILTNLFSRTFGRAT